MGRWQLVTSPVKRKVKRVMTELTPEQKAAEAKAKAGKTKKVTFKANVFEAGTRYEMGKSYEISGELADKLKQFIK